MGKEIELWHGKHIVWTDGEYRVSVDDPNDARYVCAWTDDNQRIGRLSTRVPGGTPTPQGKRYLSVAVVDLDHKYRGIGLGMQMYRALLSHLGPEFDGIASYLPDVSNKRQVPAIWRRLGGKPLPDNEDVVVAKKLTEGVSLDSAERQAAFIVTVAEAYDAAPAHDPKADRYWQVLVRHTQLVLFKRLKGSGIKVTFEPDDPYEVYGDNAMKAMLYDMVMNHRLRIYSGFSDNHPTFSPDENVTFRAVHDFYTHGTVRKAFTEGLKKAARQLKLKAWPNLDDAGPLLARITLPNHAFTARGEFNAASTHMKLAPPPAQPAIFTEVVGQVCFHTIVGQFPEQKVAILPGFDYLHIGKCVPGSKAATRMNAVYEALRRGDNEIPLNLKERSSINRDELLKKARNPNI